MNTKQMIKLIAIIAIPAAALWADCQSDLNACFGQNTDIYNQEIATCNTIADPNDALSCRLGADIEQASYDSDCYSAYTSCSNNL